MESIFSPAVRLSDLGYCCCCYSVFYFPICRCEWYKQLLFFMHVVRDIKTHQIFPDYLVPANDSYIKGLPVIMRFFFGIHLFLLCLLRSTDVVWLSPLHRDHMHLPIPTKLPTVEHSVCRLVNFISEKLILLSELCVCIWFTSYNRSLELNNDWCNESRPFCPSGALLCWYLLLLLLLLARFAPVFNPSGRFWHSSMSNAMPTSDFNFNRFSWCLRENIYMPNKRFIHTHSRAHPSASRRYPPLMVYTPRLDEYELCAQSLFLCKFTCNTDTSAMSIFKLANADWCTHSNNNFSQAFHSVSTQRSFRTPFRSPIDALLTFFVETACSVHIRSRR